MSSSSQNSEVDDEFADELAFLEDEGEKASDAKEAANGNPAKSTTIPNKSSSSPAPNPSTSQSLQTPPRPRGVAVKKAPGTSARQRSNDELEELTRSNMPSSSESLGSGAMSESESDVEDTRPAIRGTGGSMYPIDGKFTSQKDKQEIMAMPEAKREQILSERMEELERENFTRQLRERHEVQQQEAVKAAERKKRKASADPDDSPRKASRPKTKANETLENYKRHREQLHEQREQRHEQRRKGVDRNDRGKDSPSRKSGSSSEVDADGEEDVGWHSGTPQAKPAAQKEPDPGIHDFQRVRCARTNLVEYCYTPEFDTAIVGCFLRVVSQPKGPPPRPYRMVQIKEVVSCPKYMAEDSNGKKLNIDKQFVVAYGKEAGTFKFDLCSQSGFTEHEFRRYKDQLARSGQRLPTKAFLVRKIDDINSIINHKWTDVEITAKLRRSGAIQSHAAIVERARLTNERNAALEQGDEAEIARIDAELAPYGGPRHANTLNNGPIKSAAQQEQERLTALNMAKKRAHQESLRRAQLQEAEKARRLKEANGADPFARVKTRARLHYDATTVSGSARNNDKLNVPKKEGDDLFGSGSEIDRSRTATPVPGIKPGTGTSTPRKAGTPQPNGALKNGWSKKRTADDILAESLQDDEIDIEGLI